MGALQMVVVGVHPATWPRLGAPVGAAPWGSWSSVLLGNLS